MSFNVADDGKWRASTCDAVSGGISDSTDERDILLVENLLRAVLLRMISARESRAVSNYVAGEVVVDLDRNNDRVG